MAWVETRITRTTQPQDACGIDWSNPSAIGLVRFANAGNASNGRLYDAVDPSVFYTSATPALSVNTAGRSLAKNTTVMWEGSSSKGQSAIGTGDFTIIAGGINQSNNSSQYLATIGTATTATGTTWVGHRSGSVLALNTFNGTLAATGSVTAAGKYHCIVVSRKAGVVTFWLDGAKVGTASHASSVVSAPFGLGATTGNQKEVNYAGLFLRALSDAEGAALSANPWAIFEPEVTRIWVDDVIAGAGSSITAAAGSSITSTATGQSQAASTQTAATGTSTSSTLTGAAVSSATITAANGTSTTGTLAAGGSSAATITPAGGTSTASTMVGSSTSGANVADGPPIGGFVAIGQLGTASPVASGSTIAPASGSSIAETLTSSTSAAATIASAAGTSVTSTMVGASTSGTAATMTAAGGTSTTSTMTSSAISSAVMLVNNSSSITSTMVGFPPTENNADTHDGYFHKLWAKLAKKPEYQLEILEERLEEIAEEIQQVKAITRPVIYQSAPIPQNNPFDAQAKLLQALIMESARIRRDIEDEEEAEMLLML